MKPNLFYTFILLVTLISCSENSDNKKPPLVPDHQKKGLIYSDSSTMDFFEFDSNYEWDESQVLAVKTENQISVQVRTIIKSCPEVEGGYEIHNDTLKLFVYSRPKKLQCKGVNLYYCNFEIKLVEEKDIKTVEIIKSNSQFHPLKDVLVNGISDFSDIK